MRNFLFLLFLPLAACEPLTLVTVPDANGYVPTAAAPDPDSSQTAQQTELAAAPAPATVKERTAAWPDKVAFKGKVLSITLNDGTVCKRDTQGVPTGTVTECKWPLHYALENFYPKPFQGPAGVNAKANPYTQVTLTAPNGLHWVFQTPIVAF